MIRVALVEDNSSMRKSLRKIIEMDSGCRCVGTYPDAEQALAELPKQDPEVALIDVHLPGLSGIECTTRLKQLLPAVKIIMITVYEDSERIFASLRAGACGYFLKRCLPEEIIAAIHEAHKGGVPMPREVAQKVIGSFRQEAGAETKTEEFPPSEQKILNLLAQGLANKEIAARLGLTTNTVRWYLERIYGRLGVHSRIEAVLKLQKSRSSNLP